MVTTPFKKNAVKKDLLPPMVHMTLGAEHAIDGQLAATRDS